MKRKIRREIKAKRDSLHHNDRKERSRLIEETLFSLDHFKEAKTILFYAATKSEVATEGMIRHGIKVGKRVILPVTRGDSLILSKIEDYDLELAPGAFGILEPKPEYLRLVEPAEIDLAIIPGIAFDEEGGRIGHGGGHYDRLLARMREETHLIALAYEDQVVKRLPQEDHDIPIEKIITEARLLSTI